jgi:hypothetical protein
MHLAARDINATALAFLVSDSRPAIAIPPLLGGIFGGLAVLMLFSMLIMFGARMRRRLKDRRISMGAFLAQDPDLCSLAEVEVISVSKGGPDADDFTYVLTNGDAVCVAKGNSIRKLADSSQSSVRSVANTVFSQQKRVDVTAVRKGDTFKAMESPSLQRSKIEATALASRVMNPREVFTIGDTSGIQHDTATVMSAPTVHQGYARRVRPGTILVDALVKCPAVDWGVVSAASKRAKASQYVPTAGPLAMMQRLSMSFDKILGHLEAPLHIGTNPFLFPQSKSRVLKRMPSQIGEHLPTDRLASRALLDSSASRGARVASVRLQHRPHGPRLISTISNSSSVTASGSSKRTIARI